MSGYILTNDKSIILQFNNSAELVKLFSETIYIKTILELPEKLFRYRPRLVIWVQPYFERHFFDIIHEINNNIHFPHLNLILVTNKLIPECRAALISELLPVTYTAKQLLEMTQAVLHRSSEQGLLFESEISNPAITQAEFSNEAFSYKLLNPEISDWMQETNGHEKLIFEEKLELRDAFNNFNEQLLDGISFAQEITDLVDRYLNASDQEKPYVTQQLEGLFWELFQEICQQLVSVSFLPLAKRLFLRYGILDTRLITDYIVDMICNQPYSNVDELPVYYADEWLCSVFKAEREISFVDELSHKILARDYAEIEGDKALSLELENIKLMCKIVSGRKGRKTSVLDRAYFQGLPEDVVCNRQRIFDQYMLMDDVLDPTLFNRATLYGPRHVPPVFLIVPGYGRHSSCWQTWEKSNRDFGPARIICPLVSQSSFEENILGGFASYRWEYVKNTFITSWDQEGLIADYIRIKSSNKGDMLESFVKDYIIWITKESNNRTILDKDLRRLFWIKCPLSDDVVEKLKQNVSFRDLYAQRRKRDSVD